MSGWTIGGIAAILYTVLVLYTAWKKEGIIWKLAKAKLGGDKIKDETAAKIMNIFGIIVGIAGIVFFVLGA
jgi:hypothetical protein